MGKKATKKTRLPVAATGESEHDSWYISPCSNVSADEAARLEEQVRVSSGDLAARLRLIGYYQRSSRTKDDIRASMPHLIWIIENRPRDYGCYYLGLGASCTPKQFRQYRDAWLKQIEANPNDDRIIGNAANNITRIASAQKNSSVEHSH